MPSTGSAEADRERALIRGHMNFGTLFTNNTIETLNTSETRIKYLTEELPLFVYCLICGSREQQQQLAQAGFLNKPFVAYYKKNATSKSKIPFSQFRMPERRWVPDVAKSHTALTLVLRHGDRFLRQPEPFSLVKNWLKLKHLDGTSCVDVDCSFVQSSEDTLATSTKHSLLTYLAECIANHPTSPVAPHRLTILRELLLNENAEYGSFSHDPTAVCYIHDTLNECYQHNTYTYLVGFCPLQLAYFYAYIFPEAICQVKSIYGQVNDEHISAIQARREELPLILSDLTAILVKPTRLWERLHEDVIILLLGANVPRALCAEPELHLTAEMKISSLQHHQWRAPFIRMEYAAKNCALLSIQTWRYQSSLGDPIYDEMLALPRKERFKLVVYLEKLFLHTFNFGINKIEDHSSEEFRRRTLQIHMQRHQHHQLYQLSQTVSAKHAQEILECTGPLITVQPLPPPGYANVFVSRAAHKMYKVWLDMQAPFASHTSDEIFRERLREDRHGLLRSFLHSIKYDQSQFDHLALNWAFFCKKSIKRPRLCWDTLMEFLKQYSSST